MRNDSIHIIGVLNVNRQGVVVINGVNQLEQMKHVYANNDLLFFALVELKIVGVQKQMR